MRVALGGTFDRIHKGHKLIFERAFAIGEEVLIGVTSDEMAEKARGYSVSPVSERKKRLMEFLQSQDYSGFEIVEISDVYGPAPYLPNLDAIVASEETKATAEEINRMRGENGLDPLEIHLVPLVLAEDGQVISSTRIRKGEIDEDGKLLKTLVVNIGSKNKAKIWATRDIFLKVFKKVEFHGVKVESSDPDTPMEDQVIEGAINRAKEAIGEADYGVGIEGGIVRNEELGEDFLEQYCAIIDRRGTVTIGHAPGYVLPESISRAVREGLPFREAILRYLNLDSIEEEMGTVGNISKGLTDRKQLTEQAVLMALLPRIRPDLYPEVQGENP